MYDKLTWNQDVNCTDAVLFGRIRRRVLLFDAGDLSEVDTDDEIRLGFVEHSKLENAIQVSSCTRPGGCGGGGGWCLLALWTANPDPSGGFVDINNQDCDPPAAGWNLYKKLDGQQIFQIVGPIRSNIVYRDYAVRRGATYHYAFKPLDQNGDEGTMTSPKSVTIIDTVLPPPPGGFAAVAGQGKITISWDPVHAGDAYEYNVYASSVSGGPYDIVTAGPVETRTYVITNLQHGQTLYVVVTSVDTSGNESSNSVEASATAQ